MAIKNMKDIKRKKQQLEFESRFYKKEMLSSASSLFGNLADSFRGLAFDFGFRLINRLVFSHRKKQQVDVK